MNWDTREGLIALDAKTPSSGALCKTDAMLARSDKGLCVDCGGPKDDEGLCAACREDC